MCWEADVGDVAIPWNAPLAAERFWSAAVGWVSGVALCREETSSAALCAGPPLPQPPESDGVGFCMDFPASLPTPASSSAPVQRCCLSSRAVAWPLFNLDRLILPFLSVSAASVVVCINRKHYGYSIMGPATSPRIIVLETQLILVDLMEKCAPFP